MAHWMCARRDRQATGWLQRFDPRFWTVDFARPAMASLVTTAPDGLRVEVSLHSRDALVGLIWDSEDRWDHPLLAYDTDRDYRRTTLSFDWASGGVMPLDAVNGPTLTIEGRDESGAARSWYVRLWNYAEGTPEAAHIRLPLGALSAGFLLPEEGQPVFAGAIDRLFISIVAPGYDGTPAALDGEASGWVELSAIRVDGARSHLPIGDAMIPDHGLSMATGYDDAYNQAPERVLRQIEALGYRGPINHYVGMSHFPRLAPAGARLEAGGPGAPLCAPAESWHRDFLTRAGAMGFQPILSLSFELLDAHCPPAWRQLNREGGPALTGWSPPSALLSPANREAVAWLGCTAAALVALMLAAGVTPRLQIGEPWWWLDGQRRLYLYDPAARAALGGDPPALGDLAGPLTPEALALLDRAGALLADATASILSAARAVVPELVSHILLYLPTVLDPTLPELARANVPTGWAGAFDIVQIEDYAWCTAGQTARRRAAVARLRDRLGCSAANEQYLAGFVLSPDQAQQWSAIAAAIEAEQGEGRPARFIWALPQVARDGFTFFDSGSAGMDGFDDVTFPLALSRGAVVTGEFSTNLMTGLSGEEWRSAEWADARLSYDIGPGLRSEADCAALLAFFRARRGPAVAFRFTDPLDHDATDEWLVDGDGVQSSFALVKRYGGQLRRITRPEPASIAVAVDGTPASGWSLAGLGLIEFAEPPPAGARVSASFGFAVPVRFADDRLELHGLGAGAGAPSVVLVQVKEG